MSTVGLEFSSFVNPNLTWKTVSKGRSTLRRSRRPALKNSKMGHEQNKSLKKVESQGSESGKTTGITRRFNDSMEHVPIKKRRFLFRSPSPPPQSPHKEFGDLENCMSDQPGPAQVEMDSDSGIDGKILKTTDEVHGCGDDFSGIAILAAAACIDILDKPSANTMRSTINESVTTQHNKALEAYSTVEDSLPASAACQTSEGAKTSSASRDDRLHWDLNAPMDEWDHPLDDTVNSAMKLEITTVDCLVSKEHANMWTVKEYNPQPSIDGVNTNEALLRMTNNSGTELAELNDAQTGKDGVTIAGEALPELMHVDSGLHLSVQEYGAGPSSCMKVGIKDSSDICHAQAVGAVDTVDHCLLGSTDTKTSLSEGKSMAAVIDLQDVQAVGTVDTVDDCLLGSNDTKTSLSEGKSTAAVIDLQDVAKEGPASAMEVDNTEKSEVNLSLKTVQVEVNYDINDASCKVMKNSTKLMESDEKREDLQGLHFHPFQCYPKPCEKQDLDLSHVSIEDAAVDEGLNSIPHFKDTKDTGEMPKFNEVETEVSNACHQPSEASSLDAKKCKSESMLAPELEEQTCNIHNSNREDMVEPEKKNALDGNSSNDDDFCQPVEPYAVGCESAIIKDVCVSYYSKSAKSAHGAERKDESGIGDGYEALIHTKMENTSKVTASSNHLEKPPCEDSSEHVLRLHVSHEDCSQLVTSAVEGDYDSYLEDGELRESVEHCWADNDGENRESEHVDYDSDNRDEYEFTDAANGPIAEKAVAEAVCEQSNQLHEQLLCEGGLPTVEKSIEEDNSCPRQNSFLAEGDVRGDCLKAIPSTSNSMVMDQLSSMDNPEVVDMDLDDGRKSGIISDNLKEDEYDGVKDIRDIYMKGPGMKDSRRELQSRIEGPLDRRVVDTGLRSRYSNFKRSYYRDERKIGVDESLGRRSLHADYGGRVGNRYWNPGLRSVVSNPTTEGDDERIFEPSDDTSLGAHRQGTFHASRGRYIHPVRTGSPTGRAEEYVTSESSQRNSYDRHFSGMRREGYGRPIHEASNSSRPMSNHLIKKEGSFSPGGSRIGPHPPRSHRRSRSRSRTQSPDLRPEGRMGRTRMQYQNADHFRERRSPLRVFCPGQRFDTTSGRLRYENCRPFTRPVRFMDVPPSGRAYEYENGDDYKRKTYLPRSHRRSRSRSRSCSPEFRSEARMATMRPPYPPTSHTGDHMADRRSPQRMFHPGKRFDTMGSPGRLSSDDYSRPIPRPVGFQDAALPSSRGNEYEGDDYRRKSRTIFDRIHPKRSYDMENDDWEFDYDAEDGIATPSFRRNDVYVRGADRRPVDVVRGAREERRNTRYNSGRFYSTGPKPFGIREYSDDGLPRHPRPE